VLVPGAGERHAGHRTVSAMVKRCREAPLSSAGRAMAVMSSDTSTCHAVALARPVGQEESMAVEYIPLGAVKPPAVR
jgi:hypothetical protein